MLSYQKHLEKSKTTYVEHAKWALVAGGSLLLASLASFIHAVYPGWFTGTSARTVIRLYHQRLSNHPNPEYQDYIKQQSEKHNEK
jgi:hypothetical protein